MTLLCTPDNTDFYGVAQLDPLSSAAVEVVNQLGHWGNFAAMCFFFQCIQGCLRDSGVACFDALQARMCFWVSSGGCIARVSIKMKHTMLSSVQKQACAVDHKLPVTQDHFYTIYTMYADMRSRGPRS
jgi:hypothetical protein